LRFLGIILRVLRLEVSHITFQFQPLLLQGKGGEGKYHAPLLEVTVKSKEENSKDFVPIMSKNLASAMFSNQGVNIGV
jgi:hypothetical protein